MNANMKTIAIAAIMIIAAISVTSLYSDDAYGVSDIQIVDGSVNITEEEGPFGGSLISLNFTLSSAPATGEYPVSIIDRTTGETIESDTISANGENTQFACQIDQTYDVNAISIIIVIDNQNIQWPAETPTPDVTLKSIEVTTQPTKTVYTEGEDFDATGMVVTATYSDETTAPVTGYDIVGGDNLAAGTTEVTITYTEGDVTVPTTVAITVNETPYEPGTVITTFGQLQAAVASDETIIVLGADIGMTDNLEIVGKTVYLDGYNLNAGANALTIRNSNVYSGSNTGDSVDRIGEGAVTVDQQGSVLIASSIVLADVYNTYNDEDPTEGIAVTGAQTGSWSGSQVPSETYVGYGNTLTLDAVSMASGYTIISYGDVVLQGTCRIAAGAGIMIMPSGSATVSGTMMVAGTVVNYGEMTINGTVTVSGTASAGTDAAFANLGTVTVSEGATFNVNRASGDLYDNVLASSGTFNVRGTLNMNGTLAGFIMAYGSGVTINGEVVDESTVFLYDGSFVTLTSVTGTLYVSDANAATELADGVQNTVVTDDWNLLTVADVKGLTVSETVTTVTGTVDDTTYRYYYANMYVSGTATPAGTGNIAQGSIDVWAGEEAIGYNAASMDTDKIHVQDTLTLGKGVSLTVSGGILCIDGQLNAVADNSDITGFGDVITNNGTITVTGQIDVSAQIDDGTVNAAYYVITDTDGDSTYYYTTVDSAIAAIAGADAQTVYVLHGQKVSVDVTLQADQTIEVLYDMEIEATVTVESGAMINAQAVVEVTGTLTFVDFYASYVGSTTASIAPISDVVFGTEPAFTYTSLANAIEMGQTEITLSRNVTIDEDLIIPADVTVTSDRYGITVDVNAELSVEGAVELTGSSVSTVKAEDGSADVDGAVSVTGHITYVPSQTDDLQNVAGAHYTQRVSGRNLSVVSGIAYAAENVNEGTITVIGNVTAGDLTFTASEGAALTVVVGTYTDDGETIVSVLNAGTITLTDGAEIQSVYGRITASVAYADIVVDLSAAQGAYTFEADTVISASGEQGYMYLNGQVRAGDIAVSQGTVTITSDGFAVHYGDIAADDENAAFYQSVGIRTFTGTLSVASGATLSVPTGASLTTDSEDDALTVDGTISVAGRATIDGGVVAGTMDVLRNGNVTVNALTVSGTMNIDENGTVTIDRDGLLAVGDKPVDLGSEGAGAVIGEMTVNGTVKAYAGADMSAAVMDGTVSTDYIINEQTYMTVYAVSGANVYDMILAEDFALEGYYNGVNFDVDTQNTGLYDIDSWFTDAAMSPNRVLKDTDRIGAVEAVYATADVAEVTITVSEGTGLSIYIDGVAYDNGETPIQLGTHTVRFDVQTGYDGANATITFNGQTIANGGTITITADSEGLVLAASGAVPSQIVIDSGSSGDDGLGLTDYLLIILVVLIVIMAIIVALRLMRS